MLVRTGSIHYSDIIMSAMASQITNLTIVYSTVYSVTDQRKHQSTASLAIVRGIHQCPVNSSHKWPVTRKIFPFDDVIIYICDCQRPFSASVSVYPKPNLCTRKNKSKNGNSDDNIVYFVLKRHHIDTKNKVNRFLFPVIISLTAFSDHKTVKTLSIWASRYSLYFYN